MLGSPIKLVVAWLVCNATFITSVFEDKYITTIYFSNEIGVFSYDDIFHYVLCYDILFCYNFFILLSATCYDLHYFCYCLFSKLAMELKDSKNNGNVKNLGGHNSYKICF